MSDENADHGPEVPEQTHDRARETDVQESDPNADSAEGLGGGPGGGMGVSSEIAGHARGSQGDVTYGTLETHPDEVTDTGLPEQSPGGPDENPIDPPAKPAHPRDDG